MKHTAAWLFDCKHHPPVGSSLFNHNNSNAELNSTPPPTILFSIRTKKLNGLLDMYKRFSTMTVPGTWKTVLSGIIREETLSSRTYLGRHHAMQTSDENGVAGHLEVASVADEIGVGQLPRDDLHFLLAHSTAGDLVVEGVIAVVEVVHAGAEKKFHRPFVVKNHVHIAWKFADVIDTNNLWQKIKDNKLIHYSKIKLKDLKPRHKEYLVSVHNRFRSIDKIRQRTFRIPTSMLMGDVLRRPLQSHVAKLTERGLQVVVRNVPRNTSQENLQCIYNTVISLISSPCL